MNKRQFLALFLTNLAPFAVGAGVLPLLPVYAAQLGAPPALTGYYLAFANLGLTLGTLAGGWLSDRVGHRRATLGLTGLLAIPATWAMGRASGVWALTLSTAAVWFLAGVGFSTTNFLAGLFADAGERGKIYGFLALASGAGSLIGGLITGPMADRWGYPTMFALLSLFFVLWPAVALFLLDKGAERTETAEEPVSGRGRDPARRGLRLGKSFAMLFAASLVAGVATFVSILSRSLSMNALGFTAAAVSSTGAVSSALTLFLPLLIGRWSDSVGRKRLLILCYGIAAISLIALWLSSSLWHFWLAVSLSALSGAIGGSVGPALAADLIPRESLGWGLGLFNVTNWIGAIIGFAGTGTAVQHLGLAATLIASAILPLVAILLLSRVPQCRDPSGRPVACPLPPFPGYRP